MKFLKTLQNKFRYQVTNLEYVPALSHEKKNFKNEADCTVNKIILSLRSEDAM